MQIETRTKLNDGNAIPYFGLGVFQSPSGKTTTETVKFAIANGYRHIDTAKIYGNEADVGKAIHECGLPRDEIFVTTKLWNTNQGYDSALRACEESLSRLEMTYVDLYLIHWPLDPAKRKDSWKALLKIKKEGLAKSIGVSNFTIRHLEQLLLESPLKPAVNQVEFSPFLYQKELLNFCKKNEIQLEAYSPLTRGEKFKNKSLVSVAKKYGKTPAQILIRWCLEHKVVVIPKSNTPERIKENADVFNFEIEPTELKILDALNENFRSSWDPTNIP